MNNQQFWAGEFGDKYVDRNKGNVENNISLFLEIFSLGIFVNNLIEIGAGTGENLEAIYSVDKEIKTSAIEINKKAANEINKKAKNKKINLEKLFVTSFEKFIPSSSGHRKKQYDMVLTKGFLIHVHPESIKDIYEKIFSISKKYILICEYFSPSCVPISYHGHDERLWKRDFAGEMIDMFPGLILLDYGFVYKRDHFPQDNLTWFLLKKTKNEK